MSKPDSDLNAQNETSRAGWFKERPKPKKPTDQDIKKGLAQMKQAYGEAILPAQSKEAKPYYPEIQTEPKTEGMEPSTPIYTTSKEEESVEDILNKDYLTDVYGRITHFIMEDGNLDSKTPAAQALNLYYLRLLEGLIGGDEPMLPVDSKNLVPNMKADGANELRQELREALHRELDK